MRFPFFWLSGSAAALTLALSGCSEDGFSDISDVPHGNTVISAVIADGSSKTRTCVDMETYGNADGVGLLWSPSDSIGVFGNSGAHALFRNTNTSSTSAKTDFTGDLPSGDSPRRAYYPYNAANDDRSLDDLLGTLPAVQDFSLSTGKLSGDWKVGQPEAGSDSRFVFQHLFSLGSAEINADGTNLDGETLESLTVSVKSPAGEARALAGDFHFNARRLTYGNVTNPAGEIKMVWTDRPKLETGKTFTGFFSLMPTIKSGDVITITVTTDNRTATFHVNSKVDFQVENIYRFPLALGNYNKPEYGWEEQTHAKLLTFGFDVAANSGKLLNRRVVNSTGKEATVETVSRFDATISGDSVSLFIPYLYDFKLKPTFTVSDGAEVYVNDVLQKSGETEVDFTRPVRYELRTASGSHFYDVSITNSGLPVVVINQSTTGDFSEISVGSYPNKTSANRFVGVSLRGKETNWVEDDHISIYNADGSVNVANATGGVRLRGNTTQKYPKKPLAIKFKNKQSVLGMPSHKRWVLLANWLDHSMIRNAAAFAIARTITSTLKGANAESYIPWQVNGQNVELIIDGTHVGNYLLCEQIKIGGKRLNIKDAYEDVVAENPSCTIDDCGFLIECDDNYDENYKFKTSLRSIPVMLKDDVVPDDYLTQIQAKFNRIESNLNSGNYTEAYKDLDIYTSIDQWIVWELASNREYIEPRSVYYYMDGGNSKVCAGPVWDFDRATFQDPAKAQSQGSDRVKPWNKFLYETLADKDNPCMWYPLLFKDPNFVKTVKERWNILYPALLGVSAEIRRLGDINRVSYGVNNAMWPVNETSLKTIYSTIFGRLDFTDWAGDETILDYTELIEHFVRCYEGKLAAMNARIAAF